MTLIAAVCPKCGGLVTMDMEGSNKKPKVDEIVIEALRMKIKAHEEEQAKLHTAMESLDKEIEATKKKIQELTN